MAQGPGAIQHDSVWQRLGRRWPLWWQRVAVALGIALVLLALDYVLWTLLCQRKGTEWWLWARWARSAFWGANGLVLVPVALLFWSIGWLSGIRRWELMGKWMLIAVVLAGFWVRMGKVLIGRPRPRTLLHDGLIWPQWLTFQGGWDSFPSGHSATAFAVAGMLIGLRPQWARVWIAYAVAAATGRVLGCDHYLTDVLAGGALGWIIGQYCRRRWAEEMVIVRD